jgi:hypothetical protein
MLQVIQVLGRCLINIWSFKSDTRLQWPVSQLLLNRCLFGDGRAVRQSDPDSGLREYTLKGFRVCDRFNEQKYSTCSSEIARIAMKELSLAVRGQGKEPCRRFS